ncbi:MAG TPA: ABC transporter substrate-binding protein, partial [Candidatus Paceibacterota bacterium]|nr:ABC transporter substrate-binding protein [Candidatus Paceibacterota bacterium]
MGCIPFNLYLVTNLNGSLTPTRSLWTRTKTKLLDAIHAFSFTEKLIFYALLGLFGGSAIFMLAKVNEHFTLEVPVSGGEIREGVVGFPRYINPLLGVTDTGKDMALLVYSGLLKATPEGELIPDLAESYDVSDDGLTYTVKLKDNIYFHDGEPVTTKDIEFTIKKSLDPVIKSPKAAHWAGVAIEVVDEKTIRFILRHPYGPFLENLTLGILPEHVWKSLESEAFAFSQFNFRPIGSGPYKVSDVKEDKSGLPLFYELTPFKDYALGKPYINNLNIFFYSNEEKMIAAFNSGEIDQMSSISPQKAREMANREDILIDRAPLPRIFGLFLNQNEAPVFALKEVRR